MDIAAHDSECMEINVAGCKRKWKLPLLKSLPVSKVKRLRKASADDDVMDAMVDIVEEYCPGISDVLSVEDMAKVMNAWGEASGIAPGESQASPKS